MPANGIDISSFSGNWNAHQTADMGFEFVTIRATTFDSKPMVDKNFETNYLKAENAKLWRWLYGWTNPLGNIVDQATLFIDVVRGATPELGYMLDLEDYGKLKGHKGIMSRYRYGWLEPVASEVNQSPALYLNKSYADSYFIRATKTNPGDLWLINYPLCVASWGGIAPSVPWPWLPTQWVSWQCINDKTSGTHYGLQSQEATLYVFNGELL